MKKIAAVLFLCLFALSCGVSSESEELKALREEVAALKEVIVTTTAEVPVATTAEVPVATTAEVPVATTSEALETEKIKSETCEIDKDLEFPIWGHFVTERVVGEVFDISFGLESTFADFGGVGCTSILEGQDSVCEFEDERGLVVLARAVGVCLVSADLFFNALPPEIYYWKLNIVDSKSGVTGKELKSDYDLQALAGTKLSLFRELGKLGVSFTSLGEVRPLRGFNDVCKGEFDINVLVTGTCLFEITVWSYNDSSDVVIRVDVLARNSPEFVSLPEPDLVVDIDVGELHSYWPSFKFLGIDLYDPEKKPIFVDLKILQGDALVCEIGGEWNDQIVGLAPGTCLFAIDLSLSDLSGVDDWSERMSSYTSYVFKLNVTDPASRIIPEAPTFAPLVDFEWTEAREANRPFFNLVGAIETWELGYTGEGSVVAIIDTGFEVGHADFADRVILEVCLGREWHGKPCPDGGITQEGPGALVPPSEEVGSHGTGVAGAVHQMAPDARFIFIQTQGGDGFRMGAVDLAYDWIIDNALKYGIDAVVMSYSTSISQRGALISGEDCPDSDGENDEKFATMKALGVVPIAASGNDGFLEFSGPPACYENVTSVGWANEYGLVHVASNVDESLTLLAPSGLQTASAVFEERGVYDEFAGTSGAAPVVAALIAIGRQINPDTTPDELIELTRSTAFSVDDFLVKDIPLTDFLTFAETLAGGPISPKRDISVKPDGVIDIFVGEIIDEIRLCAGSMFTADCEAFSNSAKLSLNFSRMSGYTSICDEVSYASLLGVSPGTCLFKVELYSYSPDEDDTWKADGSIYQTRLLQINVIPIDTSSFLSVPAINVGETLNAVHLFDTGFFPTNMTSAMLSSAELIDAENSVCSKHMGSVRGDSPGVCYFKMTSITGHLVGYFSVNVSN